MKRLYLLIALALTLPLALFTSCDDDDKDLPDVDFVMDIQNAVYSDGQIYVVAGDTLEITSLGVINKEANRKAIIPYADYYWDYIRIAQAVVPPFGVDIYINKETRVGEHLLEVYALVYAEDKSPAFSVIQYTVNVVASPEDLPSDAVTSFRATPSIQDNDPTK